MCLFQCAPTSFLFTSEWQRVSTDTKCGRDKPVPFVKRLQCHWGWMWHCPVMLVTAWRSSCKFFRGLLAALAYSSVCAAVRSRGAWHSRPQSRWVLTQPHAPGLLLGALGPAGRPPPETAGYPGLAGCMAMHWRARPPGFCDPRCAAGARGRTGLCSGPRG